MQLFDANKCGRFHSSLLIPQSIDLEKEEVMEKSNRLLSILLMNVDGSSIHETKDLITTQSHHLEPLINIFQNCSFSTTTNHPQTLKSLGCEKGIVSSGSSSPDSFFRDKLEN